MVNFLCYHGYVISREYDFRSKQKTWLNRVAYLGSVISKNGSLRQQVLHFFRFPILINAKEQNYVCVCIELTVRRQD